MPWVGFELTISAGERPKTYALDRAATGTGINWYYVLILVCICVFYVRALSLPKIVLPYFLGNSWVTECGQYGMTWTGENGSTRRKPCSSIAWSTTEPVKTDLRLKKYLHAINLLNYGVAHFPTLANLRKAVISFIMSVPLSICPSVLPSAWDNSGPTGRIFMRFDISVFFEKLSHSSRFIKIWEEKLLLYMKTNVRGLEL